MVLSQKSHFSASLHFTFYRVIISSIQMFYLNENNFPLPFQTKALLRSHVSLQLNSVFALPQSQSSLNSCLQLLLPVSYLLFTWKLAPVYFYPHHLIITTLRHIMTYMVPNIHVKKKKKQPKTKAGHTYSVILWCHKNIQLWFKCHTFSLL